MGSEALISLMLIKPNFEPLVIAVNGNQTCYIPLREAVEKTETAKQALLNKEFDKAIQLRNQTFRQSLETYIQMSKLDLDPSEIKYKNKYNLAILNIGAPASGVNSTIRSMVRTGIFRGCRILGVQDGFDGLIKELVKELDWKSVYGWTSLGGSLLGCQRVDAHKVGLENIALKIQKLEIHGSFSNRICM
jgi:6-phosphofructokinase 1